MKYCPRCRVVLSNGYFTCPTCFEDVVDAPKRQVTALEKTWVVQREAEAVLQEQAAQAAAAQALQEDATHRQELHAQREEKLRLLRESGAEGYWEYETLPVPKLARSPEEGPLRLTLCRMGWDGWELMASCPAGADGGQDGEAGARKRETPELADTVLIFRRFRRFGDMPEENLSNS